jgi:hypothetical protein
VLFRSTGQLDRCCGKPRHVSVSASDEFLHQHKLTVQIALSQYGVETALETCLTLGLHCGRARQGGAGQRLPGKHFNGPQPVTLGRSHQGQGHARPPSASGSANAMHVVCDIEGHIKVHDVRHLRNVEPARPHIRSHQEGHPAVAETAQHGLAGGLAEITV